MRMLRLVCLLGLTGALAVAQRGEVGKGVNFYSVEKEIALGKQLAEEFRRTNRMLESPAASAYVNDLGQRLAARIGGAAFSYTFVLAAGDPAAMHEVAALPGGFLFVPSSLILAVKDEDELAGMLAHGIAHVAARHGTRQATKGELVNMATVPLIYMGGWSGYAMRQGNELAIPLGMLSFQRKAEVEADALAARSMAAVGYDPAALARYIERVQEDRSGQSKMWSALPPREERLAAIGTVIEGLPAQVYGAHDGLAKIQAEVRRLTAEAPKAPPTLGR